MAVPAVDTDRDVSGDGLGEAADEQPALAGLGMDADDRGGRRLLGLTT
ncbi:hypothetical protein [Streptomyces sp. 7N604]